MHDSSEGTDKPQSVFPTPKPKQGDTRFVRIENSTIQDPKLSFRARGLLAFVLSKPKDFTHSAKRLACPKDGVDAMERTIRELIDTGYAERITSRDSKGRIRSALRFHEAPQPSGKNCLSVVPTAENCPPVPKGSLPAAGCPTGRMTDSRQSAGVRNDGSRNDSPRNESPNIAEAPAPAGSELPFEFELKQAVAPSPTPRKRNFPLEALATINGCDLRQVTESAWSSARAAEKQIRKVCPDVTDDDLVKEIKRRVENLKQLFPNARMTPGSLAKHWPDCYRTPTALAAIRTQQPEAPRGRKV